MPFTDGAFEHPISPACNNCKHMHKWSKPPSCAAFKVIPLSVLSGDNQHRERIPNDKGVRWEPED